MGITAIIKLVPVLVLAALMMSGFDALIAAPLATDGCSSSGNVD